VSDQNHHRTSIRLDPETLKNIQDLSIKGRECLKISSVPGVSVVCRALINLAASKASLNPFFDQLKRELEKDGRSSSSVKDKPVAKPKSKLESKKKAKRSNDEAGKQIKHLLASK